MNSKADIVSAILVLFGLAAMAGNGAATLFVQPFYSV